MGKLRFRLVEEWLHDGKWFSDWRWIYRLALSVFVHWFLACLNCLYVLSLLLRLQPASTICAGVLCTGNTYLYTYDLKVIFKTNICNVRNTLQTIKHELNKADNWYKRWTLKINTEKLGWSCTCDTHFKVKLTLDKNVLPKLTSITDLDAQYWYSLNFPEHISTKASKMRKLLGFILHNFFESEYRIVLYKTCVITIVKYYSLLFSNLFYPMYWRWNVYNCISLMKCVKLFHS